MPYSLHEKTGLCSVPVNPDSVLEFRKEDALKQKEVALTGVVHGVQNHPLDEYSVHLQLRRNFSDEAIKTIFRLAEQG